MQPNDQLQEDVTPPRLFFFFLLLLLLLLLLALIFTIKSAPDECIHKRGRAACQSTRRGPPPPWPRRPSGCRRTKSRRRPAPRAATCGPIPSASVSAGHPEYRRASTRKEEDDEDEEEERRRRRRRRRKEEGEGRRRRTRRRRRKRRRRRRRRRRLGEEEEGEEEEEEEEEEERRLHYWCVCSLCYDHTAVRTRPTASAHTAPGRSP